MDDKSNYDRFSLTLPDHLNDWLYQFTLEIKRSGGYRVPKTLVLRSFIRAIKESDLKIDLNEIRDNEKNGIADKVSSNRIESMLVDRIKNAISEKEKN